MRTQKVPLSEIEQGVSGLCDRVNKADDALKEANQRLAECYRLTGAGPDGNEDWRLAEHAVEEVRRMRTELDATESVNCDLLAIAKAVVAGGMSYPKYLRDKAAAAVAKAEGKAE